MKATINGKAKNNIDVRQTTKIDTLLEKFIFRV